MNKNDYKNDFGQPVLNTQKDYEKFMVENSSKPVRDETIEESADRYVWLHAGGAKPKTYDDPFIKKIDTMSRLPQVNKLVDQKLQGNKTLNYINEKNHQYGNQPKKKLLPTEDERKQKRIDNHTLNQWGMSKPKLAELPIIKQNIKNGVHYSGSREHLYDNPTVKKYADFKENKKIKEQELKSKKEYEAEYGEIAIQNHVRAKVNKNKREGKRDYENLSSNDILVNEMSKDKAKEKLAAIKAEPVKIEPTYIDYRLALKDTGPTISLEEHMARTAPREIDPGGITALDGVREFKNTVDATNQKFPTGAGGLGPLLGENS